MADVAQTFIDNSATREQQALLRQQRLAEILQQQAFQPDQKFSYAGVEASPSGAAALAKGLQGGIAGYLQGRALKGQDDLVKKTEAREERYGADLAKALAAGTEMREGPRPSADFVGPMPEKMGGYEGIAAALQNINNPDVTRTLGPQMAMAQIKQQQEAADRTAKLADAKELKAAPGNTTGETPMTVKEWEYFSKLPKDTQEQFLAMKRANPYINLGASMAQMPQAAPGPALASVPKTLPPQDTPETRGAQAAAVEGAKNQVDAQSALPAIETNAVYLTDLLNKMDKHPGLSGVVGMPNVQGALRLPGTKEADFRTLLDQVKGKQFLEAYQSIKGSGAITELEGTKAGEAIARMQTAQTEGAFREALKEFQGVVQIGLRNARVKAWAPQINNPLPAIPAAPAPSTLNGATGLSPEEQQELDQLRSRFRK